MTSKTWIVLLGLVSLCQGAIYPRDSHVKMLDAKGFKKAMEVDQTSLVAFVAPWCGHCQRMVPEYSKAAKSLHPLVPVYAVDCDEEANKRLCGEQGVKGFPTVKLFPRGKSLPPMTYESGDRTSTAFFLWASRRIPAVNKKQTSPGDVRGWVKKTSKSGKPRAFLLTKDKKVPLLWQVLANKYHSQLEFASHHDENGKSGKELGKAYVDEEGKETKSKVLVYAAGDNRPSRFRGSNKLDSLSKFLDSLIDGTAKLEYVPEGEEDDKPTADSASVKVEPTRDEL